MAAHGCFKLSVYVLHKINAYPNATDVAVGEGGGNEKFQLLFEGVRKILIAFSWGMKIFFRKIFIDPLRLDTQK